jgi:hypothetical protein
LDKPVSSNSAPAKQLAIRLIEMLSSHEEDLIALEVEVPAVAQLRRAVGMTIAESCYWISDQVDPEPGWTPSADSQTSEAK